MHRLSIVTIATICHETNRAYCTAIGDPTQVPWADAPQWQRDSAIAGVVGIESGRITGPGDSHASWMQEKIDTGWTYGDTKDPERKQHPCIVPFEMLPYEQQAKDELFFHTASLLLRIARHG
ncbi:MAG TPA: RyR domain-containing protein [Vicinamibacterales bacterium]|nr:RyR domain-containing protein [Vicinamibacterales bacterium]